jgi:hypothetical protein
MRSGIIFISLQRFLKGGKLLQNPGATKNSARFLPVFSRAPQHSTGTTGTVRAGLNSRQNHTVSPLLTQDLICHPASPCPATVHGITVDLNRDTAGGLTLSYRLHGSPGDKMVPPAQPSSPADGLWQHTCCELFIAPTNSPEYAEFNFSPSGQWAHYRFHAYRERDDNFSPHIAPLMTWQAFPDGFQLDVTLSPEQLPVSPSLQLGITAVIEASDGGKYYWALKHCAAQPDFHHRQSFSLTLPDLTP